LILATLEWPGRMLGTLWMESLMEALSRSRTAG
jgi:hypothetical protein